LNGGYDLTDLLRETLDVDCNEFLENERMPTSVSDQCNVYIGEERFDLFNSRTETMAQPKERLSDELPEVIFILDALG